MESSPQPSQSTALGYRESIQRDKGNHGHTQEPSASDSGDRQEHVGQAQTASAPLLHPFPALEIISLACPLVIQ